MKNFFSTLAAILVAATIFYTIKAINDRIEAAKQEATIQHQRDIDAKEAKDEDERIRKRVQEDPDHASLADRIHVKLEEKLRKGDLATPQPTVPAK